MGNLQRQCRGVDHDRLELDRPEGIYLTNEIISGTVSYIKQANACIQLIGIIYFKKRKRNGLEKCTITFFSTEFNLISTSKTKQTFQLHLDDHLPPSFNDKDTCPNISYSINLIYKNSKNQIHSSIPIRVSPLVQIDRPLLLTPLFFGPVDNEKSGIKLEIKLNRSVFTYNDTVEIYYELQNPNQEYIHQIQTSLGVYYLIESNVYQEDLCNGIENFNNISSKNKLIRNKALLNIPNKIYLPPTFQFKYGQEGDQSSFNLNIDYKIQFKIYLGQPENLWQVDVPIVLCNSLLGQNDIASHSCVEQSDTKTEFISESSETDINVIE